MELESRTSRSRWSETFKKRIVAEASQSSETVAQIARRYDLDARRVSNWMKKFGSGIALIQLSSQVRLVGYGKRWSLWQKPCVIRWVAIKWH